MTDWPFVPRRVLTRPARSLYPDAGGFETRPYTVIALRRRPLAACRNRRHRTYRPGAMAGCPACGHAAGALTLDNRSSSGSVSSQ